jgi:hypothetical protein
LPRFVPMGGMTTLLDKVMDLIVMGEKIWLNEFIAFSFQDMKSRIRLLD